jgi:hypothetical protein
MAIQPSASNVWLLLECQHAFDPKFVYDREPPSEAARYGSAFHALMAERLHETAKRQLGEHAHPDDGGIRALLTTERLASSVSQVLKSFDLPQQLGEELTAHVVAAEKVLRQWLGGKNPWQKKFKICEVEASYAYSLKNFWGHHIEPPDENHVYTKLKPMTVAGTVDLIVETPGWRHKHVTERPDMRVVIDHKTGHADDYSNPAANPQLQTLALATDSEAVGILSADRRGLPIVYADDVGDLTYFEKRLRRVVGRIGKGFIRPGPWCSRCPAKHVCPTQTASLLERGAVIVEQAFEMATRIPIGKALMTPEAIGKFHLLANEMGKLLDKAKAEIQVQVKAHPETIYVRPDGKVLALVTKRVERLSKSSVVEALGKKEGEKILAKLRELGAIVTTDQEELHAVDNERF